MVAGARPYGNVRKKAEAVDHSSGSNRRPTRRTEVVQSLYSGLPQGTHVALELAPIAGDAVPAGHMAQVPPAVWYCPLRHAASQEDTPMLQGMQARSFGDAAVTP
jgi:hypothetical protein